MIRQKIKAYNFQIIQTSKKFKNAIVSINDAFVTNIMHCNVVNKKLLR
jgi:hypothetical protein